ncbi:MAG: hypothetical protein ACD_24C00114G0002 [uncultured bacterium]|nr:MAG: hypothetical protein ACD_24C00114G0002 [uncultured bacterium]
MIYYKNTKFQGKLQFSNNIDCIMENRTKPIKYDLEDRTFEFAKSCREFVKKLPKTLSNIEYSKQLIRASGSQAANYIEACEAISRNDFWHRIKICRKEAKESRLWLRLCEPVLNDRETIKELEELTQEAFELTMIFNSIAKKAPKSSDN